MLAGLLAAPISVSIMFAYTAFLKGQSIDEAKTKIKNDTPKTVMAGTCYWPIISFLNFRFIPLDYRPFAASLAGAIWNIYISSVVNQSNLDSHQLTETLPVQDTFRILDSS